MIRREEEKKTPKDYGEEGERRQVSEEGGKELIRTQD
jgi:hypothetical protein